MKKPSTLKVLSILATVGGLGLSILNGFVEDKKTDAKIEEKVRLALAEKEA